MEREADSPVPLAAREGSVSLAAELEEISQSLATLEQAAEKQEPLTSARAELALATAVSRLSGPEAERETVRMEKRIRERVRSAAADVEAGNEVQGEQRVRHALALAGSLASHGLYPELDALAADEGIAPGVRADAVSALRDLPEGEGRIWQRLETDPELEVRLAAASALKTVLERADPLDLRRPRRVLARLPLEPESAVRVRLLRLLVQASAQLPEIRAGLKTWAGQVESGTIAGAAPDSDEARLLKELLRTGS